MFVLIFDWHFLILLWSLSLSAGVQVSQKSLLSTSASCVRSVSFAHNHITAARSIGVQTQSGPKTRLWKAALSGTHRVVWDVVDFCALRTSLQIGTRGSLVQTSLSWLSIRTSFFFVPHLSYIPVANEHKTDWKCAYGQPPLKCSLLISIIFWTVQFALTGRTGREYLILYPV